MRSSRGQQTSQHQQKENSGSSFLANVMRTPSRRTKKVATSPPIASTSSSQKRNHDEKTTTHYRRGRTPLRDHHQQQQQQEEEDETMPSVSRQLYPGEQDATTPSRKQTQKRQRSRPQRSTLNDDNNNNNNNHHSPTPTTAPSSNNATRSFRWMGCLLVCLVLRTTLFESIAVVHQTNHYDDHGADGMDHPLGVVQQAETPNQQLDPMVSTSSSSSFLRSRPAAGTTNRYPPYHPSRKREVTLPTASSAHHRPYRPDAVQSEDWNHPISYPTTTTTATTVVPTSLLETTTVASWCQSFSSNATKATAAPRILIVHIGSHPLATHTALTLYETCQISSIHGVLTHRLTSTSAAEQLSFVKQRIPTLHLDSFVPSTSTIPYTLLSQQEWDDIIQKARPTHIIYFEPPTLPTTTTTTSLFSPLLAIRSNVQDLERLSNSVVAWEAAQDDKEPKKKKKSSKPKTRMTRTKMVYTTTTTTYGVSRQQQDPSLKIFERSLSSTILLQSFRELYGLDATLVHLPFVYGPFPMTTSVTNVWMEDGFWQGTSKQDEAAWIHLDDALRTVFAACFQEGASKRTPTTELLIVSPPQTMTTTLEDLSQFLRQRLDHGVEKDQRMAFDRLQFILAANHKFIHPYDTTSAMSGQRDVNGTSTSRPIDTEREKTVRHAIEITEKRLATTTSSKRSTTSSTNSGVAWTHLRQHNLFPCSSECAVRHESCKDASVFTPDLLVTTMNVTKECQYLAYTVDFSKRLERLPELRTEAPGGYPWPEHLTCAIAFVSDKSKLVVELLAQEQKTKKSATSTEQELNGVLIHRGWTLVWISGVDKDDLSEADYMLPKIAPGKLFSSNITRACYLEPKHFHVVPSLPILWFIMSKQIEQKAQKPKKKFVRRSGTGVGKHIWLPGSPAHRVLLYLQLFNETSFPWDAPVESYTPVEDHPTADAMAKFIMQQKHKGSERSHWPRSQLEFYNILLTQDPNIPLVDTYLVIHNMGADRSRRHRCEWYEEHLSWNSLKHNNNRDLEDLSLSFVLAKQRMEGRLIRQKMTGDDDDDWGDRSVDPAYENIQKVAAMIENENVVATDSVADVTEPEDWVAPPSRYFIQLHKSMPARRSYV